MQKMIHAQMLFVCFLACFSRRSLGIGSLQRPSKPYSTGTSLLFCFCLLVEVWLILSLSYLSTVLIRSFRRVVLICLSLWALGKAIVYWTIGLGSAASAMSTTNNAVASTSSRFFSSSEKEKPKKPTDSVVAITVLDSIPGTVKCFSFYV